MNTSTFLQKRMQELIAIHQLDSANLMARLERNALGINKKTLENMTLLMEHQVLPVVNTLLAVQVRDTGEWKAQMSDILEMFRESITATF